MTNQVTFPVAAGTPSGNQTATATLSISINDSTGAQVAAATVAGTATSIGPLTLTVAAGYKATLFATDSSGAKNTNPPSITFDVTAPPPPPVPPDPTLGTPTMP